MDKLLKAKPRTNERFYYNSCSQRRTNNRYNQPRCPIKTLVSLKERTKRLLPRNTCPGGRVNGYPRETTLFHIIVQYATPAMPTVRQQAENLDTGKMAKPDMLPSCKILLQNTTLRRFTHSKVIFSQMVPQTKSVLYRFVNEIVEIYPDRHRRLLYGPSNLPTSNVIPNSHSAMHAAHLLLDISACVVLVCSSLLPICWFQHTKRDKRPAHRTATKWPLPLHGPILLNVRPGDLHKHLWL